MNRSGRAIVLTGLVGMVGGVSAIAVAAKPETTEASLPDRSFAQRYAEMSLKLAKIDLQRATDLNKRVPNTYTPAALEPLEQAVDLAQQWYDDVSKPVADPLYSMYVRSEEAAMLIAEAEYRKALAANHRFAGTMNPDELERLRLTTEVAKMRYTKALDSANESDETRLAWQVGQLREEMIRLRARVEQLRRLN